MKFYLRIAILSLTLILSVSTTEVKPTSAVSGYRKLLQIGRGSIESAEWHPSGKRIVVNSVMGAWFYDDSLRDIAHRDDIRFAHFNAVGDLLAAVQGNQVVLFEAMTLTLVKVLDNADGEIVDLRWSPDGKKLAIITDKPIVMVWDVTTYRKLLTFQPPRENLSAVYWSPHSDKIATFDSAQTHMVIWEIAANQPQISFDMASMSKYYVLAGSLLWNPDNVHILRTAFLGESSLFQNWDMSTGKLIFEKETPGTWMAFSADGKALVLTSWFGDSRIVDPLTAESRRVLEQPVSVSLLGWSPDDRLLAGGGGSKYDKINGIIRVWNSTTGKVVGTFESHSLVQIMEWSPDSKLILSITEDNMLRILDVGTGKIAHERADHTLIGKTVAWNPDGSQIAVADSIGGVRIWDVASGQVLQTITDYNTTMLLAWQPAGNLLAIASYDETWLLGFAKNAKLRIWDTITGQAVGSSPYIEDSPLLSISWDRQGSRLVVTNYNSQFWLWDKTGLSNINWYKESGTETYAVVLDASFSPDGKYILILANVCCAGPSPHVWDVTKQNSSNWRE